MKQFLEAEQRVADRSLREASNFFSLVAMRVFAAMLLFTASLFAAAPPWTPANFHGLSVGRAHRDEAVRVLGAPDAANHTREGEELLYKARGSHNGDLTVRLDRSGVVTEIQESFPVAIPRTILYKEFGKDALTAHYSRAKCAANALYRDPRGAIELTLYPSRGIVLWPDQFGYDFAAILYVAQQPGAALEPSCVTRR